MLSFRCSLLKQHTSGVLYLIMGSIIITGCVPKEMYADQDGGYPRACESYRAIDADGVSDSFAANRVFWKAFDSHYAIDPRKPDTNEHRKLVVFMDGTGNDKSASTNVRKLYRLAVEQACKGNRIIPYYDKGVGAKWFDRVRGGIAGRGTSLNIRQAYRFLVETYMPGDEIYLIGFSRGAFTARSLNGLIEFAGLVDRKTVAEKFYDALPLPGVSNLHFSVSALYDVYHESFDGKPGFEERLAKQLAAVMTDRNMAAHKDKVRVTAIGVFDTVPALGLIRDDEPDDHRLDLYADYGFHALSLDEQRDDFRLLRFDPIRSVAGSQLEEVWFAGVHSDVGGSYSLEYNCTSKDDFAGLATTPLNWMVNKFSKFNIFHRADGANEILPEDNKPFTECDSGMLHDEYFSSGSRFYKHLGTFPRRPHIGDSVHSSVLRRITNRNLIHPHPEREPDGHYWFLGRPNPIDIDEYFKKNFRLVD